MQTSITRRQMPLRRQYFAIRIIAHVTVGIFLLTVVTCPSQSLAQSEHLEILRQAQQIQDISQRMSKCQFYVADLPSNSPLGVVAQGIVDIAIDTVNENKIKRIVLAQSYVPTKSHFSVYELTNYLQRTFPDITVVQKSVVDGRLPFSGVYLNICDGRPTSIQSNKIGSSKVAFRLGKYTLGVPPQFLTSPMRDDLPLTTVPSSRITLNVKISPDDKRGFVPCSGIQTEQCRSIFLIAVPESGVQPILGQLGLRDASFKFYPSREGRIYVGMTDVSKSGNAVIKGFVNGVEVGGACTHTPGMMLDEWIEAFNEADTKSSVECRVVLWQQAWPFILLGDTSNDDINSFVEHVKEFAYPATILSISSHH